MPTTQFFSRNSTSYLFFFLRTVSSTQASFHYMAFGSLLFHLFAGELPQQKACTWLRSLPLPLPFSPTHTPKARQTLSRSHAATQIHIGKHRYMLHPYSKQLLQCTTELRVVWQSAKREKDSGGEGNETCGGVENVGKDEREENHHRRSYGLQLCLYWYTQTNRSRET